MTRSGLGFVFAVLISIAGPTACRQAAPGSTADNSVITEQELDSLRSSSAYEVVRRLRPMFLVSRGKLSVQPGSQPALPNVYVDDQFYGDISALNAISASTIETIKYFTASEAQYKYGRGNAAGVIGIFTKH